MPSIIIIGHLPINIPTLPVSSLHSFLALPAIRDSAFSAQGFLRLQVRFPFLPAPYVALCPIFKLHGLEKCRIASLCVTPFLLLLVDFLFT